MFRTILAFYDQHRKSFPWRTDPVNPYYVYVSEIMLQQTTTQTVRDYFVRFTTRFPTLQGLAAADVNEVLLLWQGLGYYSRGRNLHAATKMIVAQSCHPGNASALSGTQKNSMDPGSACFALVRDDSYGIPNTYQSLITLPGIGDYTAKAILAIAYNQDVLPIDGNIKRVLARYFGLDVPYEQLHKAIESLEFEFYGRPGDVCQGLMDFANTICLARNPKCEMCPLKDGCQAYLKGMVNELPRPKKKVEKKIMVADGFVCIKDGCIGLNYHQPGTLLGNLWNVPMKERKVCHSRESGNPEGRQDFLGSRFRGNDTGKTIRHIFTHIDLRLTLHHVDDVECDAFIPLSELSEYPISRLTAKSLEAVLTKS